MKKKYSFSFFFLSFSFFLKNEAPKDLEKNDSMTFSPYCPLEIKKAKIRSLKNLFNNELRKLNCEFSEENQSIDKEQENQKSMEIMEQEESEEDAPMISCPKISEEEKKKLYKAIQQKHDEQKEELREKLLLDKKTFRNLWEDLEKEEKDNREESLGSLIYKKSVHFLIKREKILQNIRRSSERDGYFFEEKEQLRDILETEHFPTLSICYALNFYYEDLLKMDFNKKNTVFLKEIGESIENITLKDLEDFKNKNIFKKLYSYSLKHFNKIPKNLFKEPEIFFLYYFCHKLEHVYTTFFSTKQTINFLDLDKIFFQKKIDQIFLYFYSLGFDVNFLFMKIFPFFIKNILENIFLNSLDDVHIADDNRMKYLLSPALLPLSLEDVEKNFSDDLCFIKTSEQQAALKLMLLDEYYGFHESGKYNLFENGAFKNLLDNYLKKRHFLLPWEKMKDFYCKQSDFQMNPITKEDYINERTLLKSAKMSYLNIYKRILGNFFITRTIPYGEKIYHFYKEDSFKSCCTQEDYDQLLRPKEGKNSFTFFTEKEYYQAKKPFIFFLLIKNIPLGRKKMYEGKFLNFFPSAIAKALKVPKSLVDEVVSENNILLFSDFTPALRKSLKAPPFFHFDSFFKRTINIFVQTLRKKNSIINILANNRPKFLLLVEMAFKTLHLSSFEQVLHIFHNTLLVPLNLQYFFIKNDSLEYIHHPFNTFNDNFYLYVTEENDCFFRAAIKRLYVLKNIYDDILDNFYQIKNKISKYDNYCSSLSSQEKLKESQEQNEQLHKKTKQYPGTQEQNDSRNKSQEEFLDFLDMPVESDGEYCFYDGKLINSSNLKTMLTNYLRSFILSIESKTFFTVEKDPKILSERMAIKEEYRNFLCSFKDNTDNILELFSTLNNYFSYLQSFYKSNDLSKSKYTYAYNSYDNIPLFYDIRYYANQQFKDFFDDEVIFTNKPMFLKDFFTNLEFRNNDFFSYFHRIKALHENLDTLLQGDSLTTMVDNIIKNIKSSSQNASLVTQYSSKPSPLFSFLHLYFEKNKDILSYIEQKKELKWFIKKNKDSNSQENMTFMTIQEFEKKIKDKKKENSAIEKLFQKQEKPESFDATGKKMNFSGSSLEENSSIVDMIDMGRDMMDEGADIINMSMDMNIVKGKLDDSQRETLQQQNKENLDIELIIDAFVYQIKFLHWPSTIEKMVIKQLEKKIFDHNKKQ